MGKNAEMREKGKLKSEKDKLKSEKRMMKYFYDAVDTAEVMLHDGVKELNNEHRVASVEKCLRDNKTSRETLISPSLCLVLASALVLVVIGWAFAKYCPDVRINYETMECEAVFNVKLFAAFLLAALVEVGSYIYYCYYEFTH